MSPWFEDKATEPEERERSTLNDMGKGKLKEDLMCTFENRCGWAEHSDSRVAKAFR